MDGPRIRETAGDAAEVRRRFFTLVRTGARHRHVDVDGDDAGPGTAARPFATISRALADAEPGDVVHVGPGTYGYTAVRGFRGRPDAEPARIHVPGTTDNLLEVIGSSYVGLYGLKVCRTGAAASSTGGRGTGDGGCRTVTLGSGRNVLVVLSTPPPCR